MEKVLIVIGLFWVSLLHQSCSSESAYVEKGSQGSSNLNQKKVDNEHAKIDSNAKTKAMEDDDDGDD